MSSLATLNFILPTLPKLALPYPTLPYLTFVFATRVTCDADWLGVIDSQDVTHDSDAPHVRGEMDGVEEDHFRCHELRSSEEDARVLLRVEDAGQSEVDDLHPVSRLRQANDVLRLKNNASRNNKGAIKYSVYFVNNFVDWAG